MLEAHNCLEYLEDFPSLDLRGGVVLILFQYGNAQSKLHRYMVCIEELKWLSLELELERRLHDIKAWLNGHDWPCSLGLVWHFHSAAIHIRTSVLHVYVNICPCEGFSQATSHLLI